MVSSGYHSGSSIECQIKSWLVKRDLSVEDCTEKASVSVSFSLIRNFFSSPLKRYDGNCKASSFALSTR